MPIVVVAVANTDPSCFITMKYVIAIATMLSIATIIGSDIVLWLFGIVVYHLYFVYCECFYGFWLCVF